MYDCGLHVACDCSSSAWLFKKPRRTHLTRLSVRLERCFRTIRTATNSSTRTTQRATIANAIPTATPASFLSLFLLFVAIVCCTTLQLFSRNDVCWIYYGDQFILCGVCRYACVNTVIRKEPMGLVPFTRSSDTHCVQSDENGSSHRHEYVLLLSGIQFPLCGHVTSLHTDSGSSQFTPAMTRPTWM